MELLLISFLVGVLTVLSPCILPLLPIIFNSLFFQENSKKPYVVIFSLACTVIIFTLFLKGITLLINIPMDILQYISGFIVLFLGVINIFPSLWDSISAKFIQDKSEELLRNSSRLKGNARSIMTGIALGPVFVSSSPTYGVIVAAVLSMNNWLAVINLIVYTFGLTLVMFLISRFGQNFTQNLKFIADPYGWFRKGLGLILIIVSLAFILGYGKRLSFVII